MARSRFMLALMLGLGCFITAPQMASATPATAAVVNVDGLPQDKLDQIQRIVNDSRQTSQSIADSVTKAVSPEALSSYAEVGKSIGVGLAATAKELGIAANNFAQTGIGKIALLLIVWKLMLGEIMAGVMSSVLGMIWAGVVIRIWTRYFRQICLVETTTTEKTERFVDAKDGTYLLDKDGKNVTVPVTSVIVKNYNPSNGDVGLYRFMMFIALGIALIPAMVLIF